MVDEHARQIEAEIDTTYAEHPLLLYRHADALHATFIAANELLDDYRGADSETHGTASDTIINGLRYGLGWLFKNRRESSDPRVQGIDPVPFAKTFIQLAVEYVGMVTAYTYASENILDLRLDGRTLKPSGQLLSQLQYEAYNKLLKPAVEAARSQGYDKDPKFYSAVESAWKRGVVFPALPLERGVLSVAYGLMDQHSDSFYDLPRDWKFDTLSLRAFRAVHNVMRGILFTWTQISSVLERLDRDLPHGPALPFAITKRELITAVNDVADIPAAETKPVLNVLEYGGAGIENADPALQPLVPLPSGHYLLGVPLVLGTAAERNLVTLVNRLPAERKAYGRLTNQKEAAMRNRLVSRLPPHLQSWSGRLPGRTDAVDLAVVDRNERVLLLLELKWFIDPAEVREILNRSKELAKGVGQCRQLLNLPADALRGIPGAPFSQVAAAVISSNWIGFGDVQDPDIAIVNEEHIAAKLRSSQSLSEVTEWLRTHRYLPKKGEHFDIEDRVTRVGEWTLDWYRVINLRPNEPFMPL